MPDEILSFASGEPSRERLEELLALARTYRGWTNRELANALDRDVHSVVPSTGNPKLDLVVKLAAILEWPVEMVVADLYDRTQPKERCERSALDAKALNVEARAAFEAGDYRRAIAIASEVESTLADSASRGYAAHVLAISLHALGRYSESLAALRRGLTLAPIESELSARLLKSLACHYYEVGELAEATALAAVLIDRFKHLPRRDSGRAILADALHVRGSCRRIFAARKEPGWEALAADAIDDLERCRSIVSDPGIYAGMDQDRWVGVTATAEILDLRCLLGEISSEVAIAQIVEFFGDGDEDGRSSAELDCRAWWAIVGCGIVRRHESDAARAERLLAILTNKADEIAERSGNWALRERVWQVEHSWRMERDGIAESPADHPLDQDDLRNLAGTMGRFPNFRSVGWEILRRRSVRGGEM